MEAHISIRNLVVPNLYLLHKGIGSEESHILMSFILGGTTSVLGLVRSWLRLRIASRQKPSHFYRFSLKTRIHNEIERIIGEIA